MEHTILLFYKYVELDPDAQKKMHQLFCRGRNMNGRIIVSKEGINATIEGKNEDAEAYVNWLKQDPRFADVHIKRSKGNGSAFPKLSVKIRDEIVSLHLGKDDVDPNKITGNYLSADELHQWYTDGKEFYVVDMRNDYEFNVGHFENSMIPKAMKHFRDLPKALPEIESLKDKTVVTVCTGGVRCEKASGYLLNNGFNDVHQLHGGMHTYMEKYPDGFFKGKLYTFDGRVTMGFNENPEIVGVCSRCGDSSENYIDCGNLSCHRHTIVCENCIQHSDAPQACCSVECEREIIVAP